MAERAIDVEIGEAGNGGQRAVHVRGHVRAGTGKSVLVDGQRVRGDQEPLFGQENRDMTGGVTRHRNNSCRPSTRVERRRAAEFEIDARWRVALAAWRPTGVLAAVDRRRVALVGDDRRARPLDDRREAAGVVAVLVGHQHRRYVVEGEPRIVKALGELIDGDGRPVSATRSPRSVPTAEGWSVISWSSNATPSESA